METPQLNPIDLYQRRKQKDASRLRAYNTILQRIYHRIRVISELPQGQAYLLYTIEPFIFGLPKYDLEDLVVYLVYQLRHHGYVVRYTPPNLLFISWQHHEKSYLTEQNPIMLSMMESAEKTQVELERKEREAARLIAPRKSKRNVRFETPGQAAIHQVLQGPPNPYKASLPSFQGPSFQGASVASVTAPSQKKPVAGSNRSAGEYVPSTAFLQSVMNPK